MKAEMQPAAFEATGLKASKNRSIPEIRAIWESRRSVFGQRSGKRRADSESPGGEHFELHDGTSSVMNQRLSGRPQSAHRLAEEGV